MQRCIVASAFLSLVIPLALNAQSIPPQNTTCTQTDPIALAACVASTTATTISTTTPATSTDPFPIDIPIPPSIVNVREALTTWLQKNTPVSPDAQAWLNIGPLSATNEDSTSASSVITNLQKSLDQNTLIIPNSYYAPKEGAAASPSPEIQAEITAKLLLVQEILGKIDAIKAAMPASSAPDTNTPSMPTDTLPTIISSFTRTLQIDSEGDDVQRLQQFLAQDLTIYPEARITGYFGSLTRAAVGRWQIAHHIVSDESADGFGIVGPKTRTAINGWINSGSTGAPTSDNTSTESASSSETSVALPTQDNTSTQSDGSTDPSSLNDPMTSLVMETDTSTTSPIPTDTPSATESEVANTWSPESVAVDTSPLYDEMPPDWIGLKWF